MLKTSLFFLCMTVAVAAQQPQQSPSEQALVAKLTQEISTGLQCMAQAITLKQQLDTVTKERDELKAKAEQGK